MAEEEGGAEDTSFLRTVRQTNDDDNPLNWRIVKVTVINVFTLAGTKH